MKKKRAPAILYMPYTKKQAREFLMMLHGICHALLEAKKKKAKK